MKQFLSYLVTVLVLSVALTTASLGRSDTGPPDKVVTNHQTDMIAAFPVAEKAIMQRESKPVFDPFYNERRWGERTQYFITESSYNLPTSYHLRC